MNTVESDLKEAIEISLIPPTVSTSLERLIQYKTAL